MALKDWNKLKSGIDHYKLKDGVGDIWMDVETKSERLKPLAVRGPLAHRWGTTYTYIVYHHYLGDGGHPDRSTFKTKSEAHKRIMNHVKNKNY
jgi:hypothetical protein